MILKKLAVVRRLFAQILFFLENQQKIGAKHRFLKKKKGEGGLLASKVLNAKKNKIKSRFAKKWKVNAPVYIRKRKFEKNN